MAKTNAKYLCDDHVASDGVTATNVTHSVLTDHLGSVVGILDHSGIPAIGESFAAYGEAYVWIAMSATGDKKPVVCD